MSSGPAVSTIKPTDLRGILKYVPRFQGQIFVVAIDGGVVADENFANILVDIAVLRSLGIKVVIVHGIGKQIRDLSELRGIPITDSTGEGATDAATLDLAIRAASRVSHQILEGLTQTNLKCAITNAVRAIPIGILKGVDQQFSGRVDRMDKDFLLQLIGTQVVPIVQPIGFDRDGHTLRVNSDLLAREVAEALGATKIIYLAESAGLEIDGDVRREMSADDLRGIVENKPDSLSPRIRSKAQQAVLAIAEGVQRVHLVDGRIYDGLINEIFSNIGVGSLIYGNDYQQIRKATRRDVRKGDRVVVISGNDKGETGEVVSVLREKNRVVVEGVNLRWKHRKPSQQNPQSERVRVECPIHASNVMHVDPATGGRLRRRPGKEK
jgi:amino-acid N-acetyltransferase